MEQEGTSIGRSLKTPRAAALAGILFAALLIASLTLIRMSIPADPQGPAADVIAHAKTIAFGLNLIPFAGIAFLWFIAVVRDRLGVREDRFFVTVFLGSGYLFVATLFVSAALAGAMLVVLAVDAESLIRSGGYALARAAVYQAANIYAVKMAGVFMVTTSTVFLRTGVVSRWLAFFGYALAAALLLSAGTIEWVSVVFPLWVLLVSVHILMDDLRSRSGLEPPPTGAAIGAALALSLCAASSHAAAGERQQARLVARTVLPAATYRAGSPPSGAFLSADERATAAANGIRGPAEGPYLAEQPVQGFSSMVPAGDGSWWALADNGYAWRPNSGDFQLVLYRVDPRWGDSVGPRVVETVQLRDPDRQIPWTIVCDPGSGRPLPGFSFNAMPTSPPACGGDPAARILTGFDLDPESLVRTPDGTFWVSEEFGPFLLHVARDGRLLEPPVPFPGVRSPQNPFLEIADRARAERPNLAASRGPEGLAISPDGSKLYALLEGAVTGDDPQDLRIHVYQVAHRAFSDRFLTLRLEMPSQTVNLASLTDAAGDRVYPGEVAPPRGPVSIGELKAVNDRQLLVIERDNHGDDMTAPRFKKVFLLDLPQGAKHDGHVGKTLLLDLLAIPDPSGVGGDGDFFRLPFYTIESVHVVDEHTLLIASDNNFPLSNGRSRSATVGRSGPLSADSTELILVRLGTPLDVDPRLMATAVR